MQYLINGIIVGCIIVLGSTGFSLLYALLGFPNLAYGELMILGAYFTLFFNGLGMSVYGALLFSIPATALAALMMDRVVFKKLRTAGLSTLIMASFGVALFVRSLIRVVWGTGAHYFSMTPPSFVNLPFGAVMSVPQVMIIAYTAVVIVILHLFLKRTKLGKATRAVTDNRSLALVSGIDTEKVVIWNLLVASLLAVSGGVFLAIDSSLNPLQGWRLLLPVYAATIFGRVGSMYGALIGGLLVGLAQECLVVILPSAYKPGIAFAAIILIIFFRSGVLRRFWA
jgi:branched-chain amino acid transport system permease protein/neutral amino acid transport system permease protein